MLGSLLVNYNVTLQSFKLSIFLVYDGLKLRNLNNTSQRKARRYRGNKVHPSVNDLFGEWYPEGHFSQTVSRNGVGRVFTPSPGGHRVKGRQNPLLDLKKPFGQSHLKK